MLRVYIRQAAYTPLVAEVENTINQPWLESRGGKQGQAGVFRQFVQCGEKHAEEIMGRYGEMGRNTPVKIIWGKEDDLIPVDRAEKLASEGSCSYRRSWTSRHARSDGAIGYRA